MDSKAERPLEAAPELSDEAFRLLVEVVSDYAIFMLGPKGHVRTWNRGAARLKQYTAEEIIGKHFSIFYPTADLKAGKCELELEVAEREGRFEDEGWRLRKDGSRFWANVVITAIRSANGELRGFAKVTRDLTERRRAEEQIRQSELRLRMLVDNIQDYAIFMLDPLGRVSTWNVGAQKITQYAAAEIAGRHFSVFYPPEGTAAGFPERELRIASSAGRYEEEGWRVRKDGSKFWAHVVITAIRDGRQTLLGFAKVTRDLTDRKTAEREQAARVAAEEANRAKDEFLAMLGHELRNPLAPTLTALQLMKLRGDLRSSKEQQIIERQVKHMVRLVDDLLDVSRIGRGTLELEKERLNVRDVIARAIEIVGPLMEQRKHELDVQAPPGEILVQGDSVRLCQVFANLLTNSAKYTDPGGHISLVLRTEGDAVVTEIRDDGVGISPDLLPRVFETFVQAPQSTARSAGGMGIGLSLVRSLVRLHGGSVDAKSAGLGKGSLFTVRLPLIEEAAGGTRRAEADRVTVPEPRRRLRVLVVDDNEDARLLAADVLRLAGHDVQEAANGLTALALVEEFVPEVAVLDVGLPGMDGHELAARLRISLSGRVPRFIAMTGYGQEHDRERSIRAGFETHLVKPVDIAALLRSVDGRAAPDPG